MNYMLLFLLASMILGLWSAPRMKRIRFVLVLAVGLVLFFLISPSKM